MQTFHYNPPGQEEQRGFLMQLLATVLSVALGAVLWFWVRNPAAHAVLIGDNGTVLSKGLVNSREHLESLVTAHEMGVVSVQDYLANSKTKVA